MITERRLDLLLLATLATVTFTKLELIGPVSISNVLAAVFMAAWGIARLRDRDATIPWAAAVAALFAVAFAVVYAGGYLNIDTAAGRTQFAKGLLSWLLHSAFLVVAVAHLAVRDREFYLRAATVFVAGACANAAYGVLQLAALGAAGINLDQVVLAPLGFGTGDRGIQLFGAGVYRINGLMRDTNHFGVMLAAPAVLSLMLLRGRVRVAGFGLLFVALALSLSRSGALGFIVGIMVLAVPQGRRLLRRDVLAGLLVVGAAAVAFVLLFPELSQKLLFSRLDPDTRSTQTHIGLYGLVPSLMADTPLLGTGLNNFALHFRDVSGREEFGPHSAYIRLLVETGLMGFTLFVAYAAWVLGRAWSAASPLRIGLAAAFAATLAGNIFYLTTHIIYVDALIALAVAAPAVLGHRIDFRHAHSYRRAPAPDVRGTRPAGA